MTEEQLIRRKIADLNDLDLSFNTEKGWKKLDQRRKKPAGNWLTHMQRVAALLVLVGAIWLLVSKLAYFRKIEISEQKPLPAVRTKQTVKQPEKVLAIKKPASKARTHVPVKTLKAEQKINFDVKAIQSEIPKLNLSIKTIKPEFKQTDSIPEAGNRSAVRVVHLNDIPRTFLHTNPAKPKVFYVRIGTESVEVNPESQSKTISYIIK
ncbi:hypothetical protein GVN16_04590 [Emticicia sp. CRIBPO]|uniref:hypothetical protein n=1 Tax=Emticicia sp. CRIBPO TaxID=2683258 RepID=UPI0014132F9E|nr:hypothetical protein [Emticicia sp. CRIBPO]NBA85023.1 hypothetical protein [Emticicia sp. CRIBPO]